MKKFLFTASLILTIGLNDLHAQTAPLATSQVFADSLLNAKNSILLDVRTLEEYQAGHIKNAININFLNPEFQENVAQLDKAKTYLVYCQSGRRSAQATAKLKTLGFTNIVELQGGLNKWIADGMQTVKLAEKQP